jgi:hypothetical protein
MAQQRVMGHGLLIIEASRSRSNTPHSVGLLWAWDQPDAETSTWQHSQETDIHDPGGIRTHNPSKQRPQTHALDRAVTTICSQVFINVYNLRVCNVIAIYTTCNRCLKLVTRILLFHEYPFVCMNCHGHRDPNACHSLIYMYHELFAILSLSGRLLLMSHLADVIAVTSSFVDWYH